MTQIQSGGPQVMNLEEAAEFVRVSERTMGILARTGKVPCQRVGREWRFLRSALEAWLAKEAPAAVANGVVAPPKYVQQTLPRLTSNGNGFKDTAFALNREQRLHRWVPWIAGFSADFVDDVIQRVRGGSKRTLAVLDPFAGVGTTLVEALLNGHKPIGFEINPYAALACRLKLQSPSLDVAVLREAIDEFDDFMFRAGMKGAPVAKSAAPKEFRSRVPFFSPRVEKLALFALDFARSREPAWLSDLFLLAFGSVMVSCSNYTYEPSLGTRQAAGKPNIDDAPLGELMSKKLRDMAGDVEFVQGMLRGRKPAEKPLVIQESYLDANGEVPSRSVDLLITSPPYLNNYHYIRNTRPQLHWLELIAGKEALHKMEQASFGKFWQTVRGLPRIKLDFSYPELQKVIDKVAEQNPDRGDYGGVGWANYAATYFNDCLRFCRVSKRLLKRGATAVVVIGNNILQGVEVKSDRFLAGIAEREGFETVAIHCVREKRTGSSIINSSVRVGEGKHKIELYESAVELRSK
jgi:excisionase family DNA binding protein